MLKKSFILILNRNRKNLELLTRFISAEGYDVKGISDPVELNESVNTNEKVDLVLMDISGFNKTIWDSCEILREKEIPFIVLSPTQRIDIQRHSMEKGAEGFIVKPLVIKELLLLIKGFLER